MDGFTQDDRIRIIETLLGPDRLLLDRFEGDEAVSKLFAFTAVVRSLDDENAISDTEAKVHQC
jgi:uncharacterized protein involved in type VI secretion and phage assembly